LFGIYNPYSVFGLALIKAHFATSVPDSNDSPQKKRSLDAAQRNQGYSCLFNK
jgi:hypothetical protein